MSAEIKDLELLNNSLLDDLNTQQKLAVHSTEGPVLVLAGAGTGKTKTLTTKIAYLVLNNYALPHQILAVTFTNKAADEMKNRVASMVGHSTNGIWLGTFHSICAKILRQHAALLNLPSSFRIIDNEEQLKLIKQIQDFLGIEEKNIPKKQVLYFINRWKNKAVLPKNVSFSDKTAFYDYAKKVDPVLQIYKEYQAQMQIMGVVDFGDLILLTVELFKHNADILNIYHNQFKYILVDEYQDINVAQYLWLRLLSSKSMNICCVGDEDQSIYGWRGAEINNILRFERDYHNSTVIKLEENYRSTKNILGAANGLISRNTERLGKDLWTNNNEGEKVKLKNNYYSSDEVTYIGEYIKDLNSPHNRSTAVLVRSSYQMREFEEMFISFGIPYRVIGGPRFYDRAEIKDAIAYLRLVQMPDDNLSFLRIVNTPRRGIGNSSIQKIMDYANSVKISLFSAAECLVNTNTLRGKAKQSLTVLINNVKEWQEDMRSIPIGDLAHTILRESDYFAMLEQEENESAKDRIDNLNELIDSLKDFESVDSFLEHVSLVMDKTKDDDKSVGQVLLMTLHSSKGLEFDNVFLSGWSEGIFPNGKSIADGGLEEERRLAYVGLTRARKLSVITYALNKMIHGSWEYLTPSRFIDEIPQDYLEYIDNSTYSNKTTLGDNNIGNLFLGDKVFHNKFGYGTVTDIFGDNISINFKHAGPKQVLADFITKV